MKKFLLLFLFILSLTTAYSQVTTSPATPLANGEVVLYFDKAGTGLSTYTGTIYAHIGVTVDGTRWQNVIGSWGDNSTQPALTFESGTTYSLTLTPDLYTYFGVSTSSTISEIDVVFRSADGSQQTSPDIFISVGAFQSNLVTPSQTLTLLNSGQSLAISATASQAATFVLKANGATINTQNNSTAYNFTHTNIIQNTSYLLEISRNGETHTRAFYVVVDIPESPVPSGLVDGINVNPTDPTKVTLVLYAPEKSIVHVIGDFNNWEINNDYLLNKDSSQDRFWIELTGLSSQTNHMYQYVVDGAITIADPYSTTILDESNDAYINEATYPNLPVYPSGQTSHAVTLLRTGDPDYNWQVPNFQRPAKTDLVIYELLIRDFDALHSFDAVKARLDYLQALGINAIELMPVSEFDGNESWGYNPSFHMALDKYYGTPTAFKQFIDACHARGIAVILDVVYNHATGQNPYYRLWNTDNGGYGGQASTDSPFFNPVATHTYSVFNDFNHSQQATQDYVKRTVQYWIDEYNIDGFRWDLTKGFTQNCSSTDEGCTGAYQADRVAILKEYADYQWAVDPNFYIIFEHLGTNTEETEWVNYRLNEGKGIMVWGNHNYNYNEATMGWNDNSDFSWISYLNRGWTVPANVSYMESHDEERLMFKNLAYGNSSGSYDITDLGTALDRMELAGAFFFTVPGPKMIWQFGELGYDYSINYCINDGSIDNACRVGNKPIRWDYLNDQDRKDVYNMWSKLIQLRKQEEIFTTSNFTMDVAATNGLKKIQLTSTASNPSLKYINIIGNFGVTTQSINPAFQETGTWYDILNDNALLNVASTSNPISLAPGEFKIYGSSQVTLGLEDITLTDFSLYPNPVEDSFQLSLETQQVSIYDLSGRLVKVFEGDFTPKDSFTILDLAPSIYILKIRSNEKLGVKKILKN